jgi:D-glycero-alpha-D-manno-heptose 1-phosphate guanylyltransferase
MDKVTEAIILAGGQGTRLRSLVSNVPKPMADVLGEPFLSRLIKFWCKRGITSFTISTGYLGHVIQDYFGDKFFGCNIRYSQEKFPLGTGGALRQAILGNSWSGTQALLLNGDTWFEVNLKKLTLDAAQTHRKLITMALKPISRNDRYGSVLIDSKNNVINFRLHPDPVEDCSLINGGCYLLQLHDITKYLQTFPDIFSLEKDLLTSMCKNNTLHASIHDEKFLDIGIPNDYQKASGIFTDKP